MVRMIPDKTGRFARRPFYDQRELDGACEGLIRDLLLKRRGEVSYPVSTDDRTMLVEWQAEALVSYADLSGYGQDVKGMTAFVSDHGLRYRSRSRSPRTSGARTGIGPR